MAMLCLEQILLPKYVYYDSTTIDAKAEPVARRGRKNIEPYFH
jgi:hypothetical protein